MKMKHEETTEQQNPMPTIKKSKLISGSPHIRTSASIADSTGSIWIGITEAIPARSAVMRSWHMSSDMRRLLMLSTYCCLFSQLVR